MTTPSTLWMGEIEPYMDDNWIRNAYATVGFDVSVAKRVMNKITGAPAGYIFVDFKDTETAKRAIETLQGIAVPGTNPAKRFRLNWSQMSQQAQSTTMPSTATATAVTTATPAATAKQEYSLYVGDLTSEVTDAQFNEFFKSKYAVKSAKVVVDTAGLSKGFGFVRFDNELEMYHCMSEMNGAKGLGSRPIRINSAAPKSAMTATASSPAFFGGFGSSVTPANNFAAYASQVAQNIQYAQYTRMYQEQMAQYAAAQAAAAAVKVIPETLTALHEASLPKQSTDYVKLRNVLDDEMDSSRWRYNKLY